MTAGALTLNLEDRQFSYYYEVRDVCDHRLLDRETVSGEVEVRGRRLIFLLIGRDRRVQFEGTIDARGITVRHGDTFVFRDSER